MAYPYNPPAAAGPLFHVLVSPRLPSFRSRSRAISARIPPATGRPYLAATGRVRFSPAAVRSYSAATNCAPSPPTSVSSLLSCDAARLAKSAENSLHDWQCGDNGRPLRTRASAASPDRPRPRPMQRGEAPKPTGRRCPSQTSDNEPSTNA